MIEGIIGNGYYGDIAIDDIEIRQQCVSIRVATAQGKHHLGVHFTSLERDRELT